MKPVLGFLGIFLAFIAKGHALSCVQCFASESASCTGLSITCPPDHVCGSVYTVTSAAGVKRSEMYGRDCLPKPQCSTEGSLTIMGNIMNQIGMSCCYTNGCSPPLPKFSPVSSKTNGKICQTCATIESDWCYTKDKVACTGNETMCLLQTTHISGAESSKTAIRGCATKSICDIGSQALTSEGLEMSMKYFCTSGNNGLRGGLPLSFTLAIVLSKLMS